MHEYVCDLKGKVRGVSVAICFVLGPTFWMNKRFHENDGQGSLLTLLSKRINLLYATVLLFCNINHSYEINMVSTGVLIWTKLLVFLFGFFHTVQYVRLTNNQTHA